MFHGNGKNKFFLVKEIPHHLLAGAQSQKGQNDNIEQMIILA